MTLTERKNRLLTLYFEKFNTYVLHRKQVALLVNESVGTIDRWREEAYGPPWTKDPRSRNGRISYLLDDVVDFLIYREFQRTIN